MTDDGKIVIINDNDFGIVTKTVDGENEDADITDYVYNALDKTYTLEGEIRNPVISIEENTEPAQVWVLSENTSNEYVMIRNLAKKLSGTDRNFDVSFNVEDKTVNITKNRDYIETGIENIYEVLTEKPSTESEWTLKIDGNETKINLYNINGYNYVKLSDIDSLI